MILILEDKGSLTSYLDEEFKNYKYKTLCASNVSNAMDYVKEYNDDIEFLVVDLDLPPTGLGIRELNETEGGQLSGWIWLKYHILPERYNYSFKDNICIYSDYIDTLLENSYDEEWKNIKLFSKRGDSIKDVVRYVMNKVTIDEI